MRTPASIAGHPIHPMLVPIPIGLWIFSLVCDLIHAGGSSNPAWPTVALYIWLRVSSPDKAGTAVWLSVIAIGLLVVSGWLGGKMVYEHGIAVSAPPDPTMRR